LTAYDQCKTYTIDKTRATFNIYPMYITYKMYKIHSLQGAEL